MAASLAVPAAVRSAPLPSWLRSEHRLLAQHNQPIYPVYDGFLKNPDGSYTLSFAYFSHNAEVVTVPPGRRQLLRAGARRSAAAHRFQAGPLAIPVRDGGRPRVRRQDALDLTYAGTTTGTSERMLQSNWNLVEGAAELARIDYAQGAARRVPESRAAGARAGHDRAARSSADDRRHDWRGTESLRQRHTTKGCRAA